MLDFETIKKTYLKIYNKWHRFFIENHFLIYSVHLYGIFWVSIHDSHFTTSKYGKGSVCGSTGTTTGNILSFSVQLLLLVTWIINTWYWTFCWDMYILPHSWTLTSRSKTKSRNLNILGKVLGRWSLRSMIPIILIVCVNRAKLLISCYFVRLCHLCEDLNNNSLSNWAEDHTSGLFIFAANDILFSQNYKYLIALQE